MEDEVLTARCACGWEITGPEDEVVDAVIDHGQRLHNMTATREAVLATATRSPAGGEQPAGSQAER